MPITDSIKNRHNNLGETKALEKTTKKAKPKKDLKRSFKRQCNKTSTGPKGIITTLWHVMGCRFNKMTLNHQEKMAFLNSIIHYTLQTYSRSWGHQEACNVTKDLFTYFLMASILFRELSNFKLIDYNKDFYIKHKTVNCVINRNHILHELLKVQFLKSYRLQKNFEDYVKISK